VDLFAADEVRDALLDVKTSKASTTGAVTMAGGSALYFLIYSIGE
jgi:hypothetical protein